MAACLWSVGRLRLRERGEGSGERWWAAQGTAGLWRLRGAMRSIKPVATGAAGILEVRKFACMEKGGRKGQTRGQDGAPARVRRGAGARKVQEGQGEAQVLSWTV